MDEKNTWGWVVGSIVVIVVVVVAALWWWMQAPAQAPATTNGTMASSTIATSTPPTSVVTTKKSETVAAIVADLSSDSQYESLWNSTGVSSSIVGKGPYTVFVSTDAGFNLLPPNAIGNMTTAQRKRMIQYSVVARSLDINAQDTGSIKTLSGDELNFEVGPGGVVQVNSSYALEEYKGSNGIVYVLNEPLLPPTSKNILTP